MEISVKNIPDILVSLNYFLDHFCLERNDWEIPLTLANKLATNFLLDFSKPTQYYKTKNLSPGTIFIFSAPFGNVMSITPTATASTDSFSTEAIRHERKSLLFLKDLSENYKDIVNWSINEKLTVKKLNESQIQKLEKHIHPTNLEKIENYARALAKLDDNVIIFLATLRNREVFLDWLLSICFKVIERIERIFSIDSDVNVISKEIRRLSVDLSQIFKKMFDFFDKFENIQNIIHQTANKFNLQQLRVIENKLSFFFKDGDEQFSIYAKYKLFFACVWFSIFIRDFITIVLNLISKSEYNYDELSERLKVFIYINYGKKEFKNFQNLFLKNLNYWLSEAEFQKKYESILYPLFIEPLILHHKNFVFFNTLKYSKIEIKTNDNFLYFPWIEDETPFKIESNKHKNNQQELLDDLFIFCFNYKDYVRISDKLLDYPHKTIAPLTIHKFILQFPKEFRWDAIKLLLNINYYSKNDLQKIIEHNILQKIQEIGGNEFYLISIGDPGKSSGKIMRMIDQFFRRYHSIYKFKLTYLDQINEVLTENDQNNPIIFIDDLIISGTQFSEELLKDFYEDNIKDLKLLEKPLKKPAREQLRNQKIYFIAVLGFQEGKRIAEKKAKEYDLDCEVKILEVLRYSKYFDSNNLLDFKKIAQEIGFQLLLDKDCSDKERKIHSLGYGDHQYLLVVDDNTPTSTVTFLWKMGYFKNIYWEPLLPRTPKRRLKLELLGQKIVKCLMWKSATESDILTELKSNFSNLEIRNQLQKMEKYRLVKYDTNTKEWTLFLTKEYWIEQIDSYIEELSKYTKKRKNKSESGITRLAFTEQEKDAIILAEKDIAALKLAYKFEYDPFYNFHAYHYNRNIPRLLIGTHLDSVVNGGRFDGTVGLITFLIAMRWISLYFQDIYYPIDFVIFRAEESTVFKEALLGSKVACGFFDSEELEQKQFRKGQELDDEIIDYYLKTYELNENTLNLLNIIKQYTHEKGDAVKISEIEKGCWFFNYKPEDYYSYIEVHIEQGKILESKKVNFGIVNSFRAPFRVYFEFIGQTDHSGATPMGRKYRKDAFCCACECVLAIEEICEKHAQIGHDIVGTVGTVEIDAKGINKIPGNCTIGLDLRSNCLETRKMVFTEIMDKIKEKTTNRNISIKCRITENDNPLVLNNITDIQQNLVDIIENLNYKSIFLPSGAGHDAKSLGLKGVPVGFLFIPCKNGISHDPEEDIDLDDLFKACEVLFHLFTELPKKP